MHVNKLFKGVMSGYYVFNIPIKCTTLTVSYNGVRIGQKNSRVSSPFRVHRPIRVHLTDLPLKMLENKYTNTLMK